MKEWIVVLVFFLFLMLSASCLVWGFIRLSKYSDEIFFMKGFWTAFIFYCGIPSLKFFIGFVIGLVKGE